VEAAGRGSTCRPPSQGRNEPELPSPIVETPRKILVAVAWPYAQGPLHLGHLAGAYLSPDIFARYHRAAGNDVLMVSGSDVHGTPITVKAEAEGVTPQEIVDRYHPEFLGYWKTLGIDFDLFTTTGTATHARVAQGFFTKLLDNGHLYRKTVDQFYDEHHGRFLPDRYIEGTCPHCSYPHARGDQCDNCGKTLDPVDLIDPVSKLSGSRPVLRPTEHYYWRLSAFGEPLLKWLGSRHGWRPHVLNFAIGMVEEGLHDRSFTRDLDWGIPIPVDDLGPGKSIYVWWEAVMGYLSAPQEWAELGGDPDAWKAWWEDPEAESYYFVGKDNVPFHAVYWPALLMGHGGLNLPTDVPANHFVTFGGEKASKSRGVGRSLGWYLERFEPDALRYAIGTNLPETNDTDLYDDEMVRSINDELVANWGNLVNRVVSMTHRYFHGVVPERTAPGDEDVALLERLAGAFDEVGGLIEQVKLRAALAVAMGAAQATNAYLSEAEPWQTAKTDLGRTGTTLNVALNAVALIATVLAPFLPFTSRAILQDLGVDVPQAGPLWEPVVIHPGREIAPPHPLFAKIEGGL
jgi:methionyl-tRNA synthetase